MINDFTFQMDKLVHKANFDVFSEMTEVDIDATTLIDTEAGDLIDVFWRRSDLNNFEFQ